MTVFSIASREVVSTAAFDPGRTGPVTADMALTDTVRHTVWAGRLELDTVTGVANLPRRAAAGPPAAPFLVLGQE